MRSTPRLLLGCLLLVANATHAQDRDKAGARRFTEGLIAREIQRVLAEQAEAWNRGDLDAFMEHYWKSDALTFSSGGETTRGWSTTKANYQRRYPTPEAMGTVTFLDLEVTPLGEHAALVLGRWKLQRKSDPVGGNFTLVFRRIDGRWLIIHDHTSQRVEEKLSLFDGKPKVVVVNGYSTSFVWPGILQRKLDRYFGGRAVLEIRGATRGGTPIAKWIDVGTGEPLESWEGIVRPALERSDGRPVIVLAQQSLQWVFGARAEGIRGADDDERIRLGAAAIGRYAERLLAEGADEVFIAMHIYKTGMEPEIGNERLALAEYLRSRPAHVYAGPDVWTPTKRLWPSAFAEDKVHPNSIGAEVMAQLWFETLLGYDGLPVPEWSRAEMRAAVEGAGRR